MQLLHYLALASVAAAIPFTEDAITKRQNTCYSQQWNIQQFTAFTAGPDSPAGGPPAFGYSHVNFKFADPNFNIQYECGASTPGQSLDPLSGKTQYCGGGNMTFKYFGSSVELQRTGVDCGE